MAVPEVTRSKVNRSTVFDRTYILYIVSGLTTTRNRLVTLMNSAYPIAEIGAIWYVARCDVCIEIITPGESFFRIMFIITFSSSLFTFRPFGLL